MLKNARKKITQHLWEQYRQHTPQVLEVETLLKKKAIKDFIFDHFAVIDLPGPKTGIPVLSQLFTTLGYQVRGNGYLPDKQNDFRWLAEENCHDADPRSVLPQVVVADFRLDEMPKQVRTIIEKYAALSKAAPFDDLRRMRDKVEQGDAEATQQLVAVVGNYLQGRDWPLPTCAEFKEVHQFNELLAWVLVFGRRANHFTFAIHLLQTMDQHESGFLSLLDFNQYLTQHTKLSLNSEGGPVKGGQDSGIAQSGTLGTQTEIRLADGKVSIPTGFVEFVWRYPLNDAHPTKWYDYFTDFVAAHADHVIESLYQRDVIPRNTLNDEGL